MASTTSNKAVFLDRDGTINNNSDYYVYSPDRFVFNPGVVETLAELTKRGYRLFIISNQSGIGKNLYSIKDVEKVHDFMKSELLKSCIEITCIMYCTHHPDSGKCLCRKPESLLFEKTIHRFTIDPKQSYMVGDSPRDIDAGKKAGLKGILIEANSDLRQILKKIK
ncbi:MAG: HAD family hydrolase [Bacteroidetes bacterium HGW-Bacteroidetes-21]|nr:MAG: HAD family hydrolase [Bacteroidetes bacterium HGW-Bacteroidetes-21]